MNKNRKTALGVIIIIAGLAIVIGVSVLTLDRPGLRMLSPMACGLFGGSLVWGVNMIERGINPKLAKEQDIEAKDERSIIIRGKAAYIAMLVMFILMFIFGGYVFHVLDNIAAGFMCYGIAFIGLLVFVISIKAIGKKM